MLMIVESLEEEALANEHRENENHKETRNINATRENVTPTKKKISTITSPLANVNREYTISDELKKRWQKSLNPVRRPAVENKTIYPKLIEELDELYEKRINERIKHLRNQYEHQEITERNKRNERKQKAIDEEKKALQEKAAQERASSEALAKELEAAKKAEEEAERKKEAANAQAKAAAEAAAKAKLESDQKQQVQPSPPVSVAPTPTAPVAPTQPKNGDSRLSVFLDINVIKGLIQSWETKCARLLKPESKEDKEMAMKIKRQVAIPVGALTQRSGTDLRAQIDKILNLVKNKDYPENKTAGDFVIYETANRFVQLAEEQLSSNEKAAPAIAIAVIALWLESAEFGELFMSQLYNTCPILIPNTFNENVDEQKLKQMGGMCRLFASLASSDCPPGTVTHPFGIENIWKFLVGTVLVPNVTELTCQALYEVLTFSGKRLQGYYKNQFGKLIKLIISNFIPRCSGGPGARLRLLLEDAIQNGFKDPPGAIGPGFWGTRDMYTGKVAGD